MTRRKAALSDKNATPNAVELSSGNPETFAIPVPEFETTSTRNLTLTLGDEDLDAAELEAMLNDWNANIPMTNNSLDISAVCYNENSVDTQNDTNFYSNALDLDNYGIDNGDLAASWATGIMNADHATAATVDMSDYLQSLNLPLSNLEVARTNLEGFYVEHLFRG